MSSTLDVPFSSLPALLRIEMPCFVRDREEMMRLVGGETALINSLKNETKTLLANLSSSSSSASPADHGTEESPTKFKKDPFRFSFEGKVQETNGLLLRIRRKKKQMHQKVDQESLTTTIEDESSSSKQNDKEGEEEKVEIVGKVTKSYVFNTPMGCQFLRSSSTSCENKSAKETEIVQSHEQDQQVHFEVCPHRFLGRRTGASHRCDIFRKGGSDSGFQGERNRRKNALVRQVKFKEGMIIPTDAPPKETLMKEFEKLRGPNKPFVEKAMSLVEGMFAMQPMWPRRLIVDFFAKEGLELGSHSLDLIFKQFLAYVSYVFPSGPWATCWTRLGYDPTLPENKDARYYQVLFMRYSASDYSHILRSVSIGGAVGKRIVNLDTLQHEECPPNAYSDHVGDVVITAFGGVQISSQYSVQLKSLMAVPQFDALITKMKCAPSGMSAHGWFEEPQLSEIRRKVKEYILTQASEFLTKENATQSGGIPQSAVMGTVLDPFRVPQDRSTRKKVEHAQPPPILNEHHAKRLSQKRKSTIQIATETKKAVKLKGKSNQKKKNPKAQKSRSKTSLEEANNQAMNKIKESDPQLTSLDHVDAFEVFGSHDDSDTDMDNTEFSDTFGSVNGAILEYKEV